MDKSTLRIVLLGKTGNGKSLSGNTILGRPAFLSKLSFKSVTKTCAEETANIFKKKVTVIDTPGILNITEDVKNEMNNIIKLALESSDPCLFLVVIKVDRFTEEEHQALKKAEELLGEEGIKKSYILFTRGDDLKSMTIEDFIYEDEEGVLPDVVKRFSGRYHVFNNTIQCQDQVEELLTKSSHLTSRNTENPEERRILLLGRHGVGKSAAGNTILGLKGSDRFESRCDFNSVTQHSEVKSASVAGRNVRVIDTPGLSGQTSSAEIVTKEVMKGLLSSEGPHAFVFVVEIGRLEKNDIEVFNLIHNIFKSDFLKYAMILFTHGDKLKTEQIDEKIKANEELKQILEMCGNRYCVFNNNAFENRWQVNNMLRVVDDMVADNNGQSFSHDMFKMGKTFILEEQSMILRQDSKKTDEASSNPHISEGILNRIIRFFQDVWNLINTFIESLWNLIRIAGQPKLKE